MAALAHNALKTVWRLGRGVGPSGPVAPADAIGVVGERSADDAVADLVPQSRCFGWADFWTIYLRPAPL